MDLRTTNMQPDELIQYWISSAQDDLVALRTMFDARNYVYALFFGHLYLEKLLKALIVQHTLAQAPYGHRLRTLAEKAELELAPDQILFLERVNEYNIAARYPDWKFEFKKRCTREFCQHEIQGIERFAQWLLTRLEH